MTGLSGSGKTTVANALSKELNSYSVKHQILDGDLIRENLSKGLGFSKEDRIENNSRIGFVCEILNKNKVSCIVAAISPYREGRHLVRNRVENFIEVYINCPLELCEKRDFKGLYKKARSGELKNFTGINDPYEEPVYPNIICHTERESPTECAMKIISYLVNYNIL